MNLDRTHMVAYNSRMRIGIDLRLPTYRMGGISQYALHLIPALASLEAFGDHEFVLFHSRKEDRSFLPQDDHRFSRKNLWTPCHHNIERWTLGLEIKPHRLDVWHSPDFIPPAWGAKHKVITIHDLTFVFYPQFLTAESRRYYHDQIQWAAETADHISVDSNATRRDVIEILGIPEYKVTTVQLAANEIYSGFFSAGDIEQTLRKNELQRGFILFVGTLEPRKNLPTLMTVYSRLRSEKNHSAPLILVGATGWEAEGIFETIHDLSLDAHVHHLTSITDQELAHLYHAAGVLVTPSYYEGFGLPALEAQHCDCPVVVSNRGSLPEIVGEKGIMLDPDDVDGWVETLDQVLTDDLLREKMLLNGRQQVKNFTWVKTAEKTMSLYEGSL